MKTELDIAWLGELCCPRCGIGLHSEGDTVTCSRCEARWPVNDGVPNFVSSFPYWGEIPQGAMIEVLRAARTSWREALLDSSDPKVTRPAEMILNLSRANWCLLTDLPHDTRVLDIGAGMGANSHALALRYRDVVAVEPVTERVQFMRQRFEQESLRNIRIVQTSLWDLPFPEGSFDLIVLNGVLEWVAQGRAGNPRDVQLAALRVVARLLRRGGVLYVGIENRFSAGHFVGYRDPHAGLPWVTILPRLIADRYARRKGEREGYRNYLYSAAGYRKLLREAGFANVDPYLALPSYNHPKFFIPLKNNIFSHYLRSFGGATGSWRADAWKLMSKLGLAKHLEYSFALLATKSAAE